MAYVYAPDRTAARPIAHLAGFRGTLQVDGYGGYKVLAQRGDVQLAFCWSHVRRRFYELAQGGMGPIANEALSRIAALYQIEDEIRGRAASERRAVRQQRSRPLVDALQPWPENVAYVQSRSQLALFLRARAERQRPPAPGAARQAARRFQLDQRNGVCPRPGPGLRYLGAVGQPGLELH